MGFFTAIGGSFNGVARTINNKLIFHVSNNTMIETNISQNSDYSAFDEHFYVINPIYNGGNFRFYSDDTDTVASIDNPNVQQNIGLVFLTAKLLKIDVEYVEFYMAGGDDHVVSSYYKDLIYGGDGNDVLSGNGAEDSIFGGNGNDILNGGLDADILVGGSGADTASYANASMGVVVSLANATINTGEAQGDTFESIERLTGSVFNDTLNGANTVNNTIRGGGGNDTLNGYTGNDYLEGGAGADKFIFNSKLNASTNVDTILDFSSADDIICLDNAIFEAISGPGTMASKYFKNLDAAAVDANDRILYDKSTGDLFYDADGSGAGVRIKFAQLSDNTSIGYQDFFMI